MAVNADPEINPYYESHYQQATQGADFIQIPGLPFDPNSDTQSPEVEQQLAERAKAYDTARSYWKITPARDLPENALINFALNEGLSSVFGDATGLADYKIHTFRSLPAFRFQGIRCRSSAEQKFIELKPEFSAGTLLRDKSTGELTAENLKECDPLSNVELKFSTRVSYETAKHHLTVSPDLAGGIKDYDPWATRHDRYQLRRYFHRRFNNADDSSYYLTLPEVLKAYEQYSLKSDSELVDEVNRTLPAPIDMGFLTAHRAPRLIYDHQFSVLEKGVDSELPVNVTNLTKLKVVGYSRTTAGELQEGLDYGRALPLVEDIAFAVPLGVRELPRWQVRHSDGFYPQRAFADESWRIFSQVTPFQVHLKFGHFNSFAWVTDMATGLPVPGASVRIELDDFMSVEPLSDLESAPTTDKDGLVMLPGYVDLDPDLQHANPYRFEHQRFMVKVVKGDDMAVLPIDRNYTAWSDIWHRKKTKDSYVHSWGTTAQGVYKAGDTIQYKLYVRNQDNRHWIAPPEGEYSLQVIDPKGQSVAKVEDLSLSDFGSFHGEFKTAESAAVGWYQFVLSYRADNKSFTYYPMRVLVSDFTPAAFRVTTELKR